MSSTLIVDFNYLSIRTFLGALNSLHHPIMYSWYLIIKKINLIIRKFNVSKVIIVLDGSKRCIRRYWLWPRYKLERKLIIPKEVRDSWRFIFRLIEIFNWNLVHNVNLEADDVMFNLSYSLSGKKILLTNDKDLFQSLSNKDVTMLNYNLDMWDKQYVLSKLNLSNLDQVVDYFSLVGDASDGLPGVKGIGPKGASKLLGKYLTLESILKACLSTTRDRNLLKVRDNWRNSIITYNLFKLPFVNLGELNLKEFRETRSLSRMLDVFHLFIST